MAEVLLTDLTFTAASPQDRQSGLLGYVAATLGPLRVSGITLRRTVEGRLTLSFPSRKDGRGRVHPIVRPLGERERREVEAAVFRALGLEEAPR